MPVGGSSAREFFVRRERFAAGPPACRPLQEKPEPPRLRFSVFQRLSRGECSAAFVRSCLFRFCAESGAGQAPILRDAPFFKPEVVGIAFHRLPSNQLELRPLLRFQSPKEDRAAENEVDAHADCHADNTPAQPQTKQRREKEPRGNGQRDGYDHGKLHIPGGAQPISQRTGKGVCQTVEDIVDEHQPDHQFLRLGRNGRAADDQRCDGKNQGVPQNDLGMRTDVLDACPKAEGMMMLIRSMAPEVVAVDEIGGENDLEALRYVMNCGCRILATVHGNSMEDIREKPGLSSFLQEKRFERYVVLGNRRGPGTVEAVYDTAGEELICG